MTLQKRLPPHFIYRSNGSEVTLISRYGAVSVSASADEVATIQRIANDSLSVYTSETESFVSELARQLSPTGNFTPVSMCFPGITHTELHDLRRTGANALDVLGEPDSRPERLNVLYVDRFSSSVLDSWNWENPTVLARLAADILTIYPAWWRGSGRPCNLCADEILEPTLKPLYRKLREAIDSDVFQGSFVSTHQLYAARLCTLQHALTLATGNFTGINPARLVTHVDLTRGTRVAYRVIGQPHCGCEANPTSRMMERS